MPGRQLLPKQSLRLVTDFHFHAKLLIRVDTVSPEIVTPILEACQFF